MFCTQLLRPVPELISFFYDEYLRKDLPPSAAFLKDALSKILNNFEFVRLVVDGIDELPPREHKTLIKDLVDLTKSAGDSCKLLVCSQDLPSISPILSRNLKLCLSDEKDSVQRDVRTIVVQALKGLNDTLDGLEEELLESITKKITNKSEGAPNHLTLRS